MSKQDIDQGSIRYAVLAYNTTQGLDHDCGRTIARGRNDDQGPAQRLKGIDYDNDNDNDNDNDLDGIPWCTGPANR